MRATKTSLDELFDHVVRAIERGGLWAGPEHRSPRRLEGLLRNGAVAISAMNAATSADGMVRALPNCHSVA